MNMPVCRHPAPADYVRRHQSLAVSSLGTWLRRFRVGSFPWLAHYDAGIPATLAPYPERTLLDYFARADCVTATSRYYVEPGELQIKGNTAIVVVHVFRRPKQSGVPVASRLDYAGYTIE